MVANLVVDIMADPPFLATGDRLPRPFTDCQKPGGIMEDRRASSRTKADWPVKVITSQGSFEGEARNVSANGAFIECEKPLNVKERCLLIMEMPKGRMAEIDAEVVWSTQLGPDEESRPRGMGVRFLW